MEFFNIRFLNTHFTLVFLFSFFFSFFSSCSSKRVLFEKDNLLKPSLSKRETLLRHSRLVKIFTKKKEMNRGIYNQFKVWITQLNTEVIESLLERQALFFHWTQSELGERRLKQQQEASSHSKIIISLFTPKEENNDLHKGTSSIWKVYLELKNARYSGKPKRIRRPYSELQILYPHHSSFSEIYEVQFDFPMERFEEETSWIVLTSHLGTVKVAFSPLKSVRF